MVGLQREREPRGGDTEPIDAPSMSALTAAFTRLAVAMEAYVILQAGSGPSQLPATTDSEVASLQAEQAGSGPPQAPNTLDNKGGSLLEEPTQGVEVKLEVNISAVPNFLEATATNVGKEDILQPEHVGDGPTQHDEGQLALPTTSNASIASPPVTQNSTLPAQNSTSPALDTTPANDAYPLSAQMAERLASLDQTIAQRFPGVPFPTAVASQVQNGPSAGRWYCVSQGRRPGVYSSWAQASQQVSGVARAVFLRHGTREDALDAYITAYLDGLVIRR